jgi:hypothetical protein
MDRMHSTASPVTIYEHITTHRFDYGCEIRSSTVEQCIDPIDGTVVGS